LKVKFKRPHVPEYVSWRRLVKDIGHQTDKLKTKSHPNCKGGGVSTWLEAVPGKDRSSWLKHWPWKMVKVPEALKKKKATGAVFSFVVQQKFFTPDGGLGQGARNLSGGGLGHA
jgi:hypothetical protein